MRKVLVFVFILFIIIIIPHCCNHLCSIGETPHATECHEQKWKGRDGDLGYSYTFYTYSLYDTTRQCSIGNPETFFIIKKERIILPDDRCEHCSMKWSWHFKK